MARPETLRASSTMFVAPDRRSVSSVTAATENGMSCSDSLRFCAVTTISSSCPGVACPYEIPGTARASSTAERNRE